MGPRAAAEVEQGAADVLILGATRIAGQAARRPAGERAEEASMIELIDDDQGDK